MHMFLEKCPVLLVIIDWRKSQYIRFLLGGMCIREEYNKIWKSKHVLSCFSFRFKVFIWYFILLLELIFILCLLLGHIFLYFFLNIIICYMTGNSLNTYDIYAWFHKKKGKNK